MLLGRGTGGGGGGGGSGIPNLVLSSFLAILSFVPYEWVAKGSLVICAFLFIVDPIPPISRLLAILSLVVVYGLTKAYNHHHRYQQEQEHDEDEDDVVITHEGPVTQPGKTQPSDTGAKTQKQD